MEYVQETLDRSTGYLVTVSLGNWITISELGKMKGVGSREVRNILRDMDFLVLEGSGRNSRHRLARWVTDQKWGRRIKRKGAFPFDTIGPEAQAWIAERWDQTVEQRADLSPVAQTANAQLAAFLARRRHPDMPPQERVCWLCDFFPSLSQAEKGKIAGVSQSLVNRFEDVRRRQLEERRARRGRLALSTV